MTTIPFAEALKLLDRAVDIHVFGFETTTGFSLDTAEGAYAFLELDLEDTCDEYFFRFLESANQTVQVDGVLMTLVYDDAVVDDIPPTLEIRLMVPMALEPSMGEVHEHQCKLESSLNRILESSQLSEVQRHARAAKAAFDWLDNFTVLRASQPEVASSADLLERDQQKHDSQDGADDLKGASGDEHAEQPVDHVKDEGGNEDGQKCGEHGAPY